MFRGIAPHATKMKMIHQNYAGDLLRKSVYTDATRESVCLPFYDIFELPLTEMNKS